MIATRDSHAHAPSPHTSRSRGRRTWAAIAAAGAVLGTGGLVGLAGPAQAAAAVPAGCSHPSEAATITCTFGYTGSTQTFRVPAGVTSVTLEAWGGHGGYVYGGPVTPLGAAGGRGAHVAATFSTAPGTSLSVVVGEHGAGIDPSTFRTVDGGFGYGAGGHSSDRNNGAGGGGGSAVMTGGLPLLVAGAGGGGGLGTETCGLGGVGGDAGEDAPDGPVCGTNPASPGGEGGVSGSNDGADGVPGGDRGLFTGGGGGGGGYLGGGGGATSRASVPSSGGGGGTSFADGSGTNVDLSGLSDRSWSSDGQVTIAFAAPDSTAPVAHPQVDQPVNPAGWVSRAPVHVDWGWQDDSGIDPGPGSCTETSAAAPEGTTTLTASCTDVWGNVGNASFTVNLDTTKPVDDPKVNQNLNGTQVAWNWSDALSGVDPTRCQQQSSTPATFGVVLTASCTDLAGNTMTDSYTVVDALAPQSAPSQSPARNANGWNNTDVTVNWGWTDSGSGLPADASKCPQQTTVSGEGEGQQLSSTCTDVAGNSGFATRNVSIDKTKPVDSPVVTTTSTGATVAWNWSDALSGVDTDSCTQSSSQTGTGQLTFTSSCTDVAGNTATDSKTVTVAAPSTKADVQVKVSGPATGKKNTAYTYTVTTKNTGPGAAKNVVSTLAVPDKATLVSASGSPVKLGPLLTWTAPSLASGGSVSYTVTVKFPTTGSWGLGAAAGSLPTKSVPATPDPNLLNNICVVITKVS
ncbi:MAG: glycine-rich protein [Nocardioides sp.]